jgi:hypothetical protein
VCSQIIATSGHPFSISWDRSPSTGEVIAVDPRPHDSFLVIDENIVSVKILVFNRDNRRERHLYENDGISTGLRPNGFPLCVVFCSVRFAASVPISPVRQLLW